MASVFKSIDTAESFKVCLLMLDTIGVCITDDYPIYSDKTNYSFLTTHLSKNKIKEFRATIRRSLKFLKKCAKDKDVDHTKALKIKSQLTDWHKYLTQQHMHLYMQNRTDGWNYLGLSMHYLVDAYYHLITKLTADLSFCSRSVKCRWCDKSLSDSWRETLSQITVNHLPTIYLYLSLSQNIYFNETPITNAVVNAHLENVKFLLQDAIKVGILKQTDSVQTSPN